MPHSTPTSPVPSQSSGKTSPWGGCLLSMGTAMTVLALLAGLFWATVQMRGQMVLVERCSATAGGETHSLMPEQTQNAALITAIANERGLPARAATIAIATAVQESNLINIDYGDRDSVGLFQQRPSQGWGTVAEIMDPVYSTNAFYDGLVKVDGYESMEITAAAQEVQRSGFPQAYADHEPEGRVFASALTGHSEHALTCRLRPAEVPADQTMAERLQNVVADLPDAAANGVATSAEAGQVTITPGSTQAGWAHAHFAVAYAQIWGATKVTYDGYAWDRDKPDDGWQPTDTPGGVVITLPE